MTDIVTVEKLVKRYKGGFEALKGVDLAIREGEILALLGPNGAGKTTLISAICGITMPSSGSVRVGGKDVVKEYRDTRSMIGLVPQEVNLELFETVWNQVRFSRGLFDKAPDDAFLEEMLKGLSLWDKKDSKTIELSGGMKRRVLIAKALSHNPRILFLDEPTAGVDVELRRGMWETVAELKRQGVTIILTTHYIEEAEAIADRIGIISAGKILLVEEKDSLMARLSQKELRIELAEPLDRVPEALADTGLTLAEDGRRLVYSYDTAGGGGTGITALLSRLKEGGVRMTDISTHQSSLEEIFVDLVEHDGADRQETAQ
ncbi:ABC transporter ATP-binding protein [Wenxinia saemankumensis]|uniref:ABC-2 type transport system ATP-binding protein n=1 Tax=Wenxinia saemankumensis TaxID=1447782 RepID=A0A1M6DSV4_9RHOB|nr:ABC transporter ATP-binding protein [Wenxinia saemankumensis]SHI76324.1 ABC-2 type transport system ATP-binding protein [Wenxinia saemankumensis]